MDQTGSDQTPGDAAKPAERLDSDAFSRLYREHYAALRAIAAGEAGLAHADDCCQQAAMTALRQLDRFEAGTDFRAWMAAYVRGAARNMRRGEQRRRRRHMVLPLRGNPSPIRDSDGQAAHVMADESGQPTAKAGSGLDRSLRNALDSVGPMQRTCILMKAVLGYSYAEIAEILDIPEATARSHVHRARRLLAERIDAPSSGKSGHE
jgi:RNA polymerase sigma-70 factor (ECF subfamily)